ncbi:uncharacterized protein LOC143515193 [Brachyhypopomus gauderio]|uniref:uncharacterized protein LOC143515193 n=1 Tax=Brachyhypopomus gauderio TaxID=698409 RepID=UPI00404126CB
MPLYVVVVSPATLLFMQTPTPQTPETSGQPSGIAHQDTDCTGYSTDYKPRADAPISHTASATISARLGVCATQTASSLGKTREFQMVTSMNEDYEVDLPHRTFTPDSDCDSSEFGHFDDVSL